MEQEIHFLSNITVNTLEAMSSIHKMEHYFATFLTGVEILVADRLPTILVSHSMLHEALLHISETLQETHSPWQIIYPDPDYYYKYGSLVYVSDSRFLYIHCRFLTVMETRFHVFEIITFSLPTHDEPNHSTRVIGLPDAVAIDSIEKFM